VKKINHILAASVLTVGLIVSGCGADSGNKDSAKESSSSSGRPSAAEISKAFKSASPESSDEFANCVGKVFHDSKLSDESLKKAVNAPKDFKAESMSKADQEVTKSKEFNEKLGKCFEMIDTSTPAPNEGQAPNGKSGSAPSPEVAPSAPASPKVK